MAECSACQILDPAVPGSIPNLATIWICFTVAQVQILGHACK